MSRRLIVVLGPGRGGTSATAGCLAKGFGVHFGDRLMPPSPANPRGYFEDLEAVALHDQMLAEAGGSWDAPTMVYGAAYAGQARAILRRLLGGGDVVGLKDPRVVWGLSAWGLAADELGVELCLLEVTRPTDAVVASLMRREGWDAGRAMSLTSAYLGAISNVTRLAPCRGAVVRYPWDLPDAAAWSRVWVNLGVTPPRADYAALREFFSADLDHSTGASDAL